MKDYFKGVAALSSIIAVAVSVIVILAVLAGSFAVAVIGLFLILFPVLALVIKPIVAYMKWRGYDKRIMNRFEALIKKMESRV